MCLVDEERGTALLRIEEGPLPREGIEAVVVVPDHQIREARRVALERHGTDLVALGGGHDVLTRDHAPARPIVVQELRQGVPAPIEVPRGSGAGVCAAGALGMGTDALAPDELHGAQTLARRVHLPDGLEGEGPRRPPGRQVEQAFGVEAGQTPERGIDHAEGLADARRRLREQHRPRGERPPDRPRERALAGAERAGRKGPIREQRVATSQARPFRPEPARVGPAGLLQERLQGLRLRRQAMALGALRVGVQIDQFELEGALVLLRARAEPEGAVETELRVVGTPLARPDGLCRTAMRLQLLEPHPILALEDAVGTTADLQDHVLAGPGARQADLGTIALPFAPLMALRALQPLEGRHRRRRPRADVATAMHEAREMPHGDPEALRRVAHRPRASNSTARAPGRRLRPLACVSIRRTPLRDPGAPLMPSAPRVPRRGRRDARGPRASAAGPLGAGRRGP